MRTQSTVCLGLAAWVLGLAAYTLGPSVSAAEPARARTAAVPTYTRDVAPILYRNCTTCHRPGEIAPMSLLTYDDARPYAKAILDEVGEGHMPPWHADAPAGTFENERLLTNAEKTTLLAWARGGAPRGNPKDQPDPPSYADGWAIGKPDAIFEMAEDYQVPAKGTIEYEYFYVPTNFAEAKWVKAIEVRPGNRSVVHHVLVQYRVKPDMVRSPVLKLDPEKSRFPPPTPGISTHPRRDDEVPSRLVASYAPGTLPQVFRPGTALRLEPGGVLQLQIHYTATGRAETDRTKVGLVFSTDAAPREVRPGQFVNTTFTIPALSADTRVDAEVGFQQDTTIWGLFPHTHVRGTKWEYVLELPDGTKKTILSVPHYNFNWQTYYMFKEPLQVPKGAKITSSAWYDNSHGNRSNPNANANVKWGDQTWEEMQYTGILFSPVTPPKPITDSKSGGQ